MNNIIHFGVVKDMYDFLHDLDERAAIVIQLHHGHSDCTSYAYRWSNDTWADWFNFNDDYGISPTEFWELTDNYTARMFEKDAELDGERCNILHAYKDGEEG